MGDPAWHYNLRANPSFEIEALVDGAIVTVPVTATEITGDEWREAYSAIVLVKLQVRDRAAAVARARDRGLGDASR